MKQKVNQQEKEIKLKIPDQQIQYVFNKVSTYPEQDAELLQKDIYYDTQDLLITNLNRGLRLRAQANQLDCLEFKSLFYNPNNNSHSWYIEEIKIKLPITQKEIKILNDILKRFELPLVSVNDQKLVDSEEEITKLLKQSALYPAIIVNKKRRQFSDNQREIKYFIDYIENLGYFLEIESEKLSFNVILEELFEKEAYEIVQNGYNDMIAEGIPGYVSNDEKQLRFKTNFDWNVLRNEKELVTKLFSKSY